MEQLKKFNLKQTRTPDEIRLRKRKRLEDLMKFKDLTIEEISKKSEIVMTREHLCNNNLKVDTVDGRVPKDNYMVWKHPNPAVQKEFRIRRF